MTHDEYYFEEGCFITELHNTETDPAVSVARARVEPGRTTLWHSLEAIQERYVIIEGRGLVEIGDEATRAVLPGEVVQIPPGCRQRITNTGSIDLLFLVVCTPRFTLEAYCDLEKTSTICVSARRP